MRYKTPVKSNRKNAPNNAGETPHDGRFWALALAVYAAEKEAPPPAKPKAYTA